MKYFIDFEFIEGFHKPLFGKRRHFVDMISIGIVAEDGRAYSAISNEYKYNDASDWVRENVISPLFTSEVSGAVRQFYDVKTFHKKLGKSNQQIANEIISFINPHIDMKGRDYFDWMLLDEEYGKKHNLKSFEPTDKCPLIVWRNQPEFYAYYADYDWVLFCSLFGTMMDLPTGFTMYCRDLKQMLDDNVMDLVTRRGDNDNGIFYDDYKKMTPDERMNIITTHAKYPKQTNEHNALADAKWNLELYKFLTK